MAFFLRSPSPERRHRQPGVRTQDRRSGTRSAFPDQVRLDQARGAACRRPRARRGDRLSLCIAIIDLRSPGRHEAAALKVAAPLAGALEHTLRSHFGSRTFQKQCASVPQCPRTTLDLASNGSSHWIFTYTFRTIPAYTPGYRNRDIQPESTPARSCWRRPKAQ